MPRRNSIGYSRRRTTRRPEPEPTTAAVNYESLANKLVRRGLATPAILTGATYTRGRPPSGAEHQPRR